MSSIVLGSIASTRSAGIGSMGPQALAPLDADMRHVLDRLAAMEPRPIAECEPFEARAQPTPMTAMKQLLRERPLDPGLSMEMRMIPGPGGDLRARVYVPTMVVGRRRPPMILYLHGGGFVTGDLDRDDETAPALARRCSAIVVSAHYRQAPEHRFPAAHEDARAAWQWMIGNAESLGGDIGRTAIAGEDAGGNLAVNVALEAKAAGGPTPRHLVLIAPMASADLTRQSHLETIDGVPLNTRTLRWYQRQMVDNEAQLGDPRLELVSRGDLGGLPPTTIILAGLDPLRSEGEAFAAALRRSGVWADCTVYDGVTAQFFGLARIVNKAMFALGQAVRNLNEAFA